MLDCLLLPAITLAEGDSTRGRFNDVWSPEGREEAMRASPVRRIEGAEDKGRKGGGREVINPLVGGVTHCVVDCVVLDSCKRKLRFF